MNLKYLPLLGIIPLLVFGFDVANAEESQTIKVEVKYTNGDRADFYGMSLVVYQDSSKEIFLEKQLESNPDTITVPKNHKYKIEIYANGMYAGVGYVQLDNSSKEITINIPLSGGLKVNVYYKGGETPIEGAKVVIKSNDNTEQRQGITNKQGETLRFWIQSTTIPEDYYIADVYIGELLLTSQKPVKLQPGLTRDEKIVTNIPEIVEDLITIIPFKNATTKISSTDPTHTVTMTNQFTGDMYSNKVNFRGEGQFSNLKSGTYLVEITPNDEGNWPKTTVQIIGDIDHFNIFKNQPIPKSDKSEEILNEIESCNCIAFRFDDVQDYWLNDVQIEYMKTFADKNTPLTIGIIANAFGEDVKLKDFIINNKNKKGFEIASHGIGNTPFTEFTLEVQDEKLKESVQKIQQSVGVEPKVFIPPQNRFNEDTKQVLIENGFTHISSSLLHGDPPPFPLKGETLYRFPEMSTTGEYDTGKNVFVGISHEKTLSDALNGIHTYGFAVITSHPQEFSVVIDGTYTNQVNAEQILELKTLIEKIKEKGIKIVPIGMINHGTQLVPDWIKNNAGWWADGSIDDETFVQGIEYLVQKQIITVSEKSQIGSSEQTVPAWIKNNAGWWADGSIDDETFVQGIEYLVKNGIITY
ncbi:polysaccharide deacetylase family protein [Nitrosopumilus sp. S6]